MLNFDWRWATVGQPVLVHDDSRLGSPMTAGKVAFVERRRQDTAVGVRLEDGDNTVVWPTRFQVHLDPRDPNDECQRCDPITTRGERVV
jgi:hypothetical protein